MNIKYCHLYYTVNKNRDDEETIDEQYAGDYFNYDSFSTPNYDFGIEPREIILR